MTRRLNERVRGRDEEEVRAQHLFGFGEFALRFLEVEVDVERLDEVGDGVVVLVAFLLDDPHDVLELLLVLARVARAAAVGNDSGGEVAQDPGAGGLDGVDEGGLEEELADYVAGGLVVEEGEQRPVDQPGAVRELGEGVVEELGID